MSTILYDDGKINVSRFAQGTGEMVKDGLTMGIQVKLYKDEVVLTLDEFRGMMEKLEARLDAMKGGWDDRL